MEKSDSAHLYQYPPLLQIQVLHQYLVVPLWCMLTLVKITVFRNYNLLRIIGILSLVTRIMCFL